MLTLPRILNLPNKLLPLCDPDVFNRYRIFLITGGRGGGKSHSVARSLLYLADKYKVRIACGRETQNSIAESVHQLLSELIRQYQLTFDIQAINIAHINNGSEFIFLGLREQGRYNIKSLEGVDILWIEEGQVVTKPTVDVVLPTIRKPNSKIFVTMNRHVFNDPLFVALKDRDDCLTIDINYLENEHRTIEIVKEAKECRKLSESDYQHIWLGEPLDQSEDALYSLDELTRNKNNPHILAPGYGLRVAGFDIARYGDDKCAAFIFQQMGALHWEEVFSDEWEHKDLNYTTGRILMICNEQRVDMAAIDEDGLGSGPLDSLQKGRGLDYFTGFRNPGISYQDNRSFGNNRTVNAYKLKDGLVKGHRCVKTQKVIDELLTIKYTFDHQQRRILVSKEKMRKDGFKSPNLADACIMAESLIGQVVQKQERQYEPQVAAYSKEENLFNLAGVR